MLGQEIQNVMSDLTGMPIKVHAAIEATFDFFRQSFKKSYVVLAKAKRSWTSEAKKTRRDGCLDQELEYWVVGHAVKIHDERSLIEVKNHFCYNSKDPGSAG